MHIEYLKVVDIATMLGCKQEQILHPINNGELPAMNISNSGGRPTWRIHPDDFEAWRESRTQKKKSQTQSDVNLKTAFANDIKRY